MTDPVPWIARYFQSVDHAAKVWAREQSLAVFAPMDLETVQILDSGFQGNWLITDRGDPEAWALADRHYTRQTPGARSFVRNGQSLVFVTRCGQAVWVSFRPTPGKAERPDGRRVIENALFRNESVILSSALILEARALTTAIWGCPEEGLITWVKPSALRAKNVNPGLCYKKDGWVHTQSTIEDRKPMFVAPFTPTLDWRLWDFKSGRGGKLRLDLTGWDGKARVK